MVRWHNTSPIRLADVDATLMVLVFLEWPGICPGDTVDSSCVCFTAPSAMRFLDVPFMSVSSGILSWAAAIWDSWSNCDSWLELLPGLNLPPLAGGVNTGSEPEPLRLLVVCELLRERACACRFGNWTG
jgi:hypothetical protein